MNLTNSASVDASKEKTNFDPVTETRATSSVVLRARGRSPSKDDVTQFEQALKRTKNDAHDHQAGEKTIQDAAAKPEAENKQAVTTLSVINGNTEISPSSGENEAIKIEGMNSQLSARVRWMERRKFLEADREDMNTQNDGAVFAALAPEKLVAQQLVQTQSETTESLVAGDQYLSAAASHAGSMVNKLRTQMTENESYDHAAVVRGVDISASPVSPVLPLSGSAGNINQASELVTPSVDMAWVSRTVQDTVRTTLRTLAQRDLESLDAGRPVQITLDQGQLRGAQLTLQAQDGLLQVSVATSQAQLRATLDAQQDVLAQGLLRDIGAVRWVGLQDALPNVSSGSEANSSSATSQQSSQGNGSDRQNQRETPGSESEEVGVSEKPADRNQVIADAQSLRAFLGL